MPCTLNTVRFHVDLTVANRRKNNVNSLSLSRNHFRIPSFPPESFPSFFTYSQISRKLIVLLIGVPMMETLSQEFREFSIV